MKITLSRDPNWLYEAAELMIAFVNRTPVRELSGDGPFCVPVVDIERLMAETCGGLDPEDPELQFFFKRVKVKNVPENEVTLAGCLLYTQPELNNSNIDQTVEIICDRWEILCNTGNRITGIDMLALAGDIPPKAYAKPTTEEDLRRDIFDLPVEMEFQKKLFQAFSKHRQTMQRMAEILRPVAWQLQFLLAPWVQKAQTLVDQWLELFREYTPEHFLYYRFGLRCTVSNMYMSLCYLAPNRKYGKMLAGHLEGVYFHAGILQAPALEPNHGADQLSLTMVMQLLSNPTRLEMLKILLKKPMTCRELARAVGANPGTTSKDLSNLVRARLLYMEEQNGSLRYRTNSKTVQWVSEQLMELLGGNPEEK